MAISSQILQVLSGLETSFLASKNAEMLYKSLSVSSDGNSNGFDITQSSTSFSFNSKTFANVGTITLAAASTVTNIQDPSADKDAAPKKWVLDQIAAVGLAVDWRNSAISRVTAPPGSPATDGRYLIKATATDDFAGKENQIAIYSGTAWSYELPQAGSWIAVNDEPTLVYNYSGSAWVAKYFELTTASGFLDQASGNVTLKNLADGKIILGDSGNLAQAVTPTGDVTISNVGATTIGAKKVLDTMIALASGKILIGDAGGAAAAQSVSGDVTISAAGATAIGSAKVTHGMIASSALGARLAGGSGTTLSVSFSETGTASSDLAAGDLVYQKADGSWAKAKANVASLGAFNLGVAAAAILDTASGLIYVHAGCKIAGFTGLTIGQKVIVSRDTAGAYAQASTGFVSGEFLYSIGRAYSATEVEFGPQYLGVYA